MNQSRPFWDKIGHAKSVDFRFYSARFLALLHINHCYSLHKTKSSFERSNSDYAIKPKKNCKTTCRHRNTVEYIAGKSFLFISLKEKLDLTLFSVRRPQYFISHTKSLIFNGRL